MFYLWGNQFAYILHKVILWLLTFLLVFHLQVHFHKLAPRFRILILHKSCEPTGSLDRSATFPVYNYSPNWIPALRINYYPPLSVQFLIEEKWLPFVRVGLSFPFPWGVSLLLSADPWRGWEVWSLVFLICQEPQDLWWTLTVEPRSLTLKQGH